MSAATDREASRNVVCKASQMVDRANTAQRHMSAAIDSGDDFSHQLAQAIANQENFDETIMESDTIQKDDYVNRESQHEIETTNQIVEPSSHDFTPPSIDTSSNIEDLHVKSVYEKIASEFDVTRTYNWSWITDVVNKMSLGSVIYDIGCGNGRNMKYDGFHFTGIDNCNAFIEICKGQNLDVMYGNILDIPLDTSSADLVMCIATFHHLCTVENRMKALFELKRLMKPNGIILISVWSKTQPKKTKKIFQTYGDNMVKWKHVYDRYYYIFRIEELEKLFFETGLSIIEKKYDCGNEIYLLKSTST